VVYERLGWPVPLRGDIKRRQIPLGGRGVSRDLEFFVRVQVISPFGGNTSWPLAQLIGAVREKQTSQRDGGATTVFGNHIKVHTYPHRLELRLEPTRAGFEPKENKVGASLYGTQIQAPADLGPWPFTYLLALAYLLTYVYKTPLIYYFHFKPLFLFFLASMLFPFIIPGTDHFSFISPNASG